MGASLPGQEPGEKCFHLSVGTGTGTWECVTGTWCCLLFDFVSCHVGFFQGVEVVSSEGLRSWVCQGPSGFS